VKQFRNRCIFTHPFDMDFSAPLSMALFFQACISEMAALICMCDIPVKVTVYLEAGLFRADRAMSPRRARPTAMAVPLVNNEPPASASHCDSCASCWQAYIHFTCACLSTC